MSHHQEIANEANFKEIRMKYSQYKKEYSQYKTLPKSYDKIDKTIVVIIPEDEEVVVDSKPSWLEVLVNQNAIEAETDTSILVKMPKKGKYGGFVFWISKKCVADRGWAMNISLNPEWKYTIKRFGTNRNVLDEKELTAKEMFNALNRDLTLGDDEYKKAKPIIHAPNKIEPEEPTVLEELKDE